MNTDCGIEQIIETLEFGMGVYSASSLSVEVVDRSTLDSLHADVAMQNLVIIFAPSALWRELY